MSFFTELKRRNVFKVAAAYLVVGWVMIEVASTVAPHLNLPEWAPRIVTFFVLIGFPLALVLAWIFDMTPEGVQVTQGGTGDKRFYGAVAVIAAVALGWFFMKVPEEVVVPAAEISATSSTATAGTPERSIAVLPFVSLSSDADDRFFGQGLAEELLNALAQFPELEVAARTSAFSFDGQDVDLREVGESLNVAHVLEGSVRRSGERLRVTAQLIRVSDGFHLWSETYERTSADIFDIQDDIVRELSRNLQVRLGVGVGAGRVEARSVDPRAYETYLRGLYLFGRRESDSDSRLQAYASFRRATEMAPDFADAWAALAMASVFSGASVLRIPGEEFRATLIEALERALSLDPNNSRAHAIKAVWYGRSVFDLEQAESHRLRALELAPNAVEPHYASAIIAATHGDETAAMRAFDRAIAIDPLNMTMRRVRANVLAQFGRYAEARTYYANCGDDCGPQARTTLNMWLLDALCSGDAEEVAARRAASLDQRGIVGHFFSDGAIALSLVLYGGVTTADLDLSLFDDADYAWLGALWYSRQGDVDRALERLQTSYDENSLFASSVGNGPMYCAPMAYPDELLRHPRYHAFWAQPGLAELAAIQRANGMTRALPK